MREILFHGKRLDNGEWVEGDLVHSYFKAGDTCIMNKENLGFYQVVPETIGQFTGLCDKNKNGKKIFEGDIVTFKTRCSSFKPCFVRWYEQEVRFLVTMPDGVHSYPMDKSWEYEVIGNVHDNKELLNED